MANHYSHAALPFPVRGARYTIQIPYLDADGDPTDPTTPDTEISKDGGAFADCAEEVSTITGSNGLGYVTLTGAEMDASMLGLAAKVASGPKATLGTFYPRILPVAFSGTASAGASGSITLAGCPAVSDLLIGCIVKTTGGTGGGGTGGANNQARVITSYTSGRVATVSPAWETNPDNTTTFEVLLTEFAALRFSDVKLWQGDAQSTADAKDLFDAGYDPSVHTISASIGSAGITSSSFSAGAINAAAIASDAITDAKVASDVTIASVTGAVGSVTAGVTLASSQSAVTFASLTCTGTFTISDGVVVTRSTANSTAILVTGSGTGHGICAKSGTGATGVGILGQSQATDGHGISGYGSGSWNGIYGWGGAGTGCGIKGQGGDTSGYGVECTAVSGAAMHAQSLSGYGFQIVATGANNAAIKLTPGSGGYGIDGTLATVATATALTTNNDKTGYALTSGERTSIANEVEAQIIDETDSEKVLAAITDKIASVNPSLDDLTLGGIASAVRTELATELARIDAAISTRLASASITLSSGKVTIGTNDDKTGYSLSTTPPTAAAIVTAIRAMEIESGETFDQVIQRMRSILYGKVAGAATVTNIFYRADGSTVAVRMTVDSDGNRSAVVFT